MPWQRKHRVYPAVDEVSRAWDGCTDSGVIPMSRINVNIQLAQQQAMQPMQLELEDLWSTALSWSWRTAMERLRSSSTAALDHQSVYSC
jgi:hypothetical protein